MVRPQTIHLKLDFLHRLSVGILTCTLWKLHAVKPKVLQYLVYGFIFKGLNMPGQNAAAPAAGFTYM